MKTMKRLGCLLLVVAMCLALGVTAMAQELDPGATITITGVSYDDQVFTAYQIFSGTASEDGTTLSNIVWGSAIDDTETITWGEGAEAKTLTIYEALAGIQLGDNSYPFKDCTSAAQVAEALEAASAGQGDANGLNAEVAQLFAKVVALFISDDATGYSSSGYPEEITGSDGTTYTYTISGITQAGYYIVMNTDGNAVGEKHEEHTEYILSIVGSEGYIIEVKETPPTIDKTITGIEDGYGEDAEERKNHVDGDDANASIGDTVDYELTISVPNISDYDSYFINIQDTLGKGLTLNDCSYDESSDSYSTTAADITITITDGDDSTTVLSTTGTTPSGFNALIYDGNYGWIVNPEWNSSVTSDLNGLYFLYGTKSNNDGSTTLYIAINDYLENYGQNGASTVKVNYSATINNNAIVGETGNQNDVTLFYPNDPTFDYGGMIIPSDNPDAPVGETPHDKTYTFTTGIQIDKIDGTTGEPLKDAQFTLTGDGVNVVVTYATKFVVSTDGAYYGLYTDSTKQTLTYTQTAPSESMTDETLALYEGYQNGVAFGVQQWVTYDIEYTESTTLTPESTNVTVETNEDGVATFIGLGAGTYTLTEVAPNGYNDIEDIEFQIVWTPDTNDPNKCTWSIVDKDGKEITDTSNPLYGASISYTEIDNSNGETVGIFEITIVNNQGTVLPGTGGIGTTIFYVIGAVLVCGAVVLLVTKRRMNNKEEANA